MWTLDFGAGEWKLLPVLPADANSKRGCSQRHTSDPAAKPAKPYWWQCTGRISPRNGIYKNWAHLIETKAEEQGKKSFSLQRLRKCIQAIGSHVPLLGWAVPCNGRFLTLLRASNASPSVKQSSNHPAAPPVTEAMLAPKETQVTTKSIQLDEHFMVKNIKFIKIAVGIFVVLKLFAKPIQIYQVVFCL